MKTSSDTLFLGNRIIFYEQKIKRHEKIVSQYNKFLINYRLYERIILNDNTQLVIKVRKARLAKNRKGVSECQHSLDQNNRILFHLKSKIEKTQQKIDSEKCAIQEARTALENLKKQLDEGL